MPATEQRRMITKSGYKHKQSFKGHRDVINCFVYNEEFLYTASNDGRILQWSLQEEESKKPLRQFGRLLDSYWTENERKFDFSDYAEEAERKEIFKTDPNLPFEAKPKEADRKKLFPWMFGINEKKRWHTQGICCLALNGRYLYSGSFDTTTIKWDTDPAREDPFFGIYKGHAQAVYSVACLDVWLLTASRDKTVRVWNEATGKQTATLGGGDAETGHTEPIRTMVLQDRLLYTGSDDRTIRQWEWRAGAMVRLYKGHTDGVTDLKLMDKFLFSSSFDMTVRTWSVETGACVRVCQAEAGLRGLEVAAGKIFGAGNNAVMYIWDLSTNSTEPLASDRLARGGLTMVAVEGNKVYCSSSDNVCRIWLKSSTPGAKQQRAPTEDGVMQELEDAPVDVLHEESEEEEEEEAGARKQRDASRSAGGDDAKQAGVMQDRYLDHMPEGVHAVCVHRGRLFSGGSDNKVRHRWVDAEGEDPVVLEAKEAHKDRVLALVVAGDGEFLFSASADTTIIKWHIATGAYESTLLGHSDWVSCLAECQGNLYSGSWDNTVRKWDVSASKFILEFLGHQDPVCCLAAVGEVLLSGSRDCTIRAWRVDTGECIKVYEGHSALVSSVVVADPIMYSASWDKTVRCWDLASGTLKHMYKKHDKPVLCLALSGGVLYAGGGDTVVRPYVAANMEDLAPMEGHTQAVNALAVGDDCVFSASDDSAVIRWSRPEAAATLADDKPDPALSIPLTQRILRTPQPGNIRTTGSISNRLNSEAQYLAQVDTEDPVPSRKEGWLLKQGLLFQRWSRRWYTLHKGVMVIYSDQSTSKPLEHVIMHDVLNATMLDNPNPNSKMFPFTLVTIDRVRKLAAHTEQEAREWVNALKKYVENNSLQKKIEQKRAARKY